MSRLSDIEVFVRVVDTGSFTNAAADLGISKSYASKRVRALEERLGAQLLHRTTRTLRVTEVGAAFHERCRSLLDGLDEAERSVTQLQATPRGTLRVTLPMSLGVRYIAPEIAAFMAAWPELEVNAEYTDRTVDLVAEGYDLAIRAGILGDSSMIARKLASFDLIVVAGTSWLAANEAPRTPDDLKRCPCLLYRQSTAGTEWRLQDASGREVVVPVTGPLTANNGDALLRAAMEGIGLTLSPQWMVADGLRDGTLAQVLPGWSARGAAVWAVYPHNRHLSAKVRVFVEHLIDQFRVAPWATG